MGNADATMIKMGTLKSESSRKFRCLRYDVESAK